MLAAVLVAASAGCAADRAEPAAGSSVALGSPPAPGSPERTAVDADADPSGNLRLLAEHGPPPLDAWGWSAAEAGTVERAVEGLTARCMAGRGFAVERDADLGGGAADDAVGTGEADGSGRVGAPAGRGGTGGASGDDGASGTDGGSGADGVLGEPVTHWGGFLGLVSLGRARTTGYQVLDVDARLAERARLEREATRTPDPAYVAALTGEGAPDATGAPRGGCSGWAFDQVTPADPAVDRRIQERLYGEALGRAGRDPAVVRALDGWVACMARNGYELDAVPVPASTDPVTPELVEQAVADVGCKDETDLVDTYVTALYEAERALAAEHRAELEAFAAWGRERVRLAAEALAG